MNMITSLAVSHDYGFQSIGAAYRQALVVIASDSPDTIQQLEMVCEFFDLAVETVSAGTDLLRVLRDNRPMAVITDIDGHEQDGFHAMKVVGTFDRDLPVMILTGGDPVMMGAVDAVQESWNLTMVSRTTQANLAGQLAEFLYTAGRRAGCMRLVQV
jgi:DNA-binding NtrC family response regulator